MSVRVRPSRSAARLVDTTVGGDTGWTLGGVTVGEVRKATVGKGKVGLAWPEHGSRRFSTMDSEASVSLVAPRWIPNRVTPTPHLLPSQA